jgi:hypothetical protein
MTVEQSNKSRSKRGNSDSTHQPYLARSHANQLPRIETPGRAENSISVRGRSANDLGEALIRSSPDHSASHAFSQSHDVRPYSTAKKTRLFHPPDIMADVESVAFEYEI